MRLTRGEVWWLNRRRSGEAQPRIAKRLGITVDRLSDWERDLVAEIPTPSLCGGPLSPGELAALLRRRAGVELADAAELFGVSRQTYIKAERDRSRTAARLAAWWLGWKGVPVPTAKRPVRIAVRSR
jgi:transcriptional regulator with XRE-family HTH domain